jgi:hypothetical protein
VTLQWEVTGIRAQVLDGSELLSRDDRVAHTTYEKCKSCTSRSTEIRTMAEVFPVGAEFWIRGSSAAAVRLNEKDPWSSAIDRRLLRRLFDGPAAGERPTLLRAAQTALHGLSL